MDRDRIERAAEDELDRQEREITAAEAFGEAGGWDTALTSYRVLAPAMGPVVGVLGEIVRTIVPDRRARRRVDLLRQLERAVRRLEGRLNLALAGRESFADLAEAVMDRVDRRETEGKTGYYAAAIANSLTPDAPAALDQAAMIAVLDALRPAHLRLVAVLRRTRLNDRAELNLNDMTGHILPHLPGWTREQLDNHWHDLQTYNIVPWLAQPRGAPGGSPYDLANQLSPFGRAFADWILLPENVRGGR